MNSLADKITKITTTYLGPAAPQFLQRQTLRHMDGLDFTSIQPKHLEKLLYWIKISASLLIKDKVDMLIADLMTALHLP